MVPHQAVSMAGFAKGLHMLSPVVSLGTRILRQLPAENAHRLGLRLFPWADKLRLLSGEAQGTAFSWQGLRFPNRIGLAAGYAKNGEALAALAGSGFGFVEVGTVTPRPQPGNPRPRLFRLSQHQALVNRMGFNNKGVDYLARQLKAHRGRLITGVNIGKNADTPISQATRDYIYCMQQAYPWCDYLVANISSPNTSNLRDLQLGEERTRLFIALAEARKILSNKHSRRVPILIKISPDTQKEEINQLVEDLVDKELDGIIATNTTTQRPEGIAQSSNGAEPGGLSGAPLFSLALECLARVAEQLPSDKLLIGSGGIASTENALAFFKAGAKLVQIYTALAYQGPGIIQQLAKAGEQHFAQQPETSHRH